ncbi:MAG TPA: hypothetical protein VNW52_02920, partial [Burkholderiaceae bacterium]|nr:hypothetical protein [Burkholderiaceae bacterium]
MNIQRTVMSQSVMAAMMCFAASANAQLTVSDDFTQGTNQVPWTVSGPACLTAGGATMPGNLTAATAGIIPTCSTSGQKGGYGDTIHPGGYMAASVLDPGGNGALRLTNASGNQAGAIVYQSTFASNAGIAITFTAMSYDGNSYTGADGGSNGADGLSFFLLDASVSPIHIGQFGGSLGYSCSQSKGGGATGGYIGLGIDEYGNFLNSGDNTATGVANTSGSHGQFQSNRIGVRGAGIVNWQQLHAAYPTQYPGSLTSSQQLAAVEKTCSTGVVWDYSGDPSNPVESGGAPVCNTFAQLNAINPTYYPNTLSSADQAAAVSNTCNGGTFTLDSSGDTATVAAGTAWDYSYSNTGPDYSQSGAPYPVGTEYSFAQLHAQYPSYYPNTLSAADQASAVQNTYNQGAVFDYSYAGTSPNYSITGQPYQIGNCYSYAQLHLINATDYPSNQAGTNIANNAVNNTCNNGVLYAYSATASCSTSHHVTTCNPGFTRTNTPVSPPASINLVPPSAVTINEGTTPPTAVPDYNVITFVNSSGVTVPASAVLPTAIAVESAGPRNAVGTYTGATAYTYKMNISSAGLLSLSVTNPTTVPPTTTVIATNWPLFGTNGALPANFTFGFAGSTGGGTNVHEITCFQAAPAEDTDSSAAINAVQAGQVKTNSAVYLAYYHTHGWWGELLSAPLTVSGTGLVAIGATANWDSSCLLTGDGTGTTLPGSKCTPTGSTSDTATPTSTNRVMLTYDNVGATGEAFEWTAASGGTAITSAQRTVLGTGDNLGQNRLNYLRGDRTNEVNATTGIGPFRARVSLLGDIVNSSPTWVGAPSAFGPAGTWVDDLYPSVSQPESAYSAFQSSNIGRLNVVYVGANDGFLHGFEAGNYISTGSNAGSVTTPGAGGNNDGKEIIAYMPAAVLSTIHNSTASAADYSS